MYIAVFVNVYAFLKKSTTNGKLAKQKQQLFVAALWPNALRNSYLIVCACVYDGAWSVCCVGDN